MQPSITRVAIGVAVMALIATESLAMQYTTRHDYNLDYGPYCQYNLPSSQSEWACGRDVWINATIVNDNDFWVLLKFRVR